MAKYNITGFEELDLENLEEYYEGEGQLNGDTIAIDLHFEDLSVAEEKVKKVEHWVNNLSKLNDIGVAAIAEDFKSGDTVREYIQHHLEELDEKNITTLLEKTNRQMPQEEQMLSALKLKGIIFSPQTEENFITLDYTLDEELTDYLVVVDITAEGHVNYITMES
jgi:hypothetical protein